MNLLSGDPNETGPGTAWDIEADLLSRLEHLQLSAARDRVILRWLRGGDLKPFAEWVQDGHSPSEPVLRMLAWMCSGPSNASEVPSDIANRTPYFLEPTRRDGKPGRPKDLINDIRDLLIAANVKNLRQRHGMTREAAIERVYEAGEETGAGISRDTIEKAINKWGKK